MRKQNLRATVIERAKKGVLPKSPLEMIQRYILLPCGNSSHRCSGCEGDRQPDIEFAGKKIICLHKVCFDILKKEFWKP